MKKITIILFCFLAYSFAKAQAPSAVFYSELGELFTIYIDGVAQHQYKESNLKILDIAGLDHNVKVKFENSRIEDVNKSINLTSGNESTFMIFKKQGRYDISLKNQIPLSQTSRSENSGSQTVVSFIKNTNVQISTTTSGYDTSNNNNNSGNANVGINMGISDDGGSVNMNVNISDNSNANNGNAKPKNNSVSSSVSSTGGQSNSSTHGSSVAVSSGQANSSTHGSSVAVSGGKANSSSQGSSVAVSGGVANSSSQGSSVSTSGGQVNSSTHGSSVAVSGGQANSTVHSSGNVSGSVSNQNSNPNSSVVSNSSVKVSSSQSSTTSGNTVKQSNSVVSGYNGRIGCSNPMSNDAFTNAKESIHAKTFSDAQLTIAKQIIDANCLIVSQIKDIMKIFDFEQSRLDFAKYAYKHTYDIDNYYQVNDAFEFEGSVRELDDYIRAGK